MQHRATFADLLDRWPHVVPALACFLLAMAIRARLVLRFRREGRKPTLRAVWETAATELVALYLALAACGVLLHLATAGR